MRIGRAGTLNQLIPPAGYGGTQRSMAHMTAGQVCEGGHKIFIVAPDNSQIVPFTKEIAASYDLKHVLASNGNYLEVTNADGRTGSLEYMPAGYEATGY